MTAALPRGDSITLYQYHPCMLDQNVIEELGKKISQLLPDSSRQLRDDLEANVHSAVQSTLSKLKLVTREEFDVQAAVLERTREKLEALQRRLDELERDN